MHTSKRATNRCCKSILEEENLKDYKKRVLEEKKNWEEKPLHGKFSRQTRNWDW